MSNRTTGSGNPPNQDAHPCEFCQGDHWTSDCHQWTPVPTSLADIKALFAANDLSIESQSQ